MVEKGRHLFLSERAIFPDQMQHSIDSLLVATERVCISSDSRDDATHLDLPRAFARELTLPKLINQI